jgi:CheY-like chemotaxis protein
MSEKKRLWVVEENALHRELIKECINVCDDIEEIELTFLHVQDLLNYQGSIWPQLILWDLNVHSEADCNAIEQVHNHAVGAEVSLWIMTTSLHPKKELAECLKSIAGILTKPFSLNEMEEILKIYFCQTKR